MSDLIKHYRDAAATGQAFRGLTILQHAEQIAGLVRTHRARTLLDYGSGAGDAWRSPHKLHKQLGLKWFDVALYDPAFPEHDDPPFGKWDGVLCSDVLEHVPEPEVLELIDRLFSHAHRFVWASVCCRPAKKLFPDGTNMHVTLHPIDWWREQFQQRAGGTAFYLVETP